jgi:hypothetical protein
MGSGVPYKSLHRLVKLNTRTRPKGPIVGGTKSDFGIQIPLSGTLLINGGPVD